MLAKVQSAMRFMLNEQSPLRADHQLFSPSGLQSLQDTALEATGISLDDPALIRLFAALPPELQWLARRYNMYDQFVSDRIFGWLVANPEAVATVAGEAITLR